MAQFFYTNAVKYGNNILFRGVKDGRRIKLRVQYAPTLFLPSKTKTAWKNLHGDYLEPKKFDSIKAASEKVRQYEKVSNFKVYGNTGYAYAFIAEEFPGMVDWSTDDVAIDIMDIETGSDNGFPNPYKTVEPITAITITRLNGSTVVFGCGDYNVKGDENYIKCEDEVQLCKKFLDHWEHDCPDVLTGWNTRYFDIPYLYNRFTILLGEKEAKRLSPWGMVNVKTTYQRTTGKELVSYDIVGVSHLDYIELYKTFRNKPQENYKLDTIANAELGDGKLSFDEYDNLHQLYKLNYQKFIEYNIKDVEIIVRLEDKLKLLELALTLAYDSKSNFEDVFTQTRMWDAIIYNYLIERHIVVPPKEMKDKDAAFEGAYVKDPQIGMHDYIASFDLNSLYPHLMMQFNISPEMLVEPHEYTPEMLRIVQDGVSVDKLLSQDIELNNIKGFTITPNGQFFSTVKQGFLPEMLEGMYIDRKKYKKLMLVAEQEYEIEVDADKKKIISKRIARYNNLQLAKKVGLNSAYGAMGSKYFRFFDIRLALAVTSSGQLSIRWIESKINAYMNKILKNKEPKDYVIASDTDSIYLKLDELVKMVYGDSLINTDVNKIISFMDKVCEDRIQPFIDRSYQELADYVHAYAQKMQMKREALANKGIWTAKKRYILNVYNNEGVQYKEPHLKVMGLEIVKSSTPNIVRNKMKDIVKIIVNGTEKDVQDYISNFRKDFKQLPAEDISFPRGVNGLATYSDQNTIYKGGTPIHVKGALLYNKFLIDNGLDKKYQKIQEGEKIKFVYLNVPNTLKSPVISYPTRLPQEFGLNDYINYNLQFEKTFLDPISVILNCVGWRSEKINTLESFFN